MSDNEYQNFEAKRLQRFKGYINAAIVLALACAVLQNVIGDEAGHWSRGGGYGFSYVVNARYFLIIAGALWVYKYFLIVNFKRNE
jgi:hypothetical protein